jgi:protein-disulfide isomerase
LGENKAGVTLTEYGDFQCPACKSYFPVVEQVVEKHKADIKFQFKHFPLVQIHQHAFESARAAEAADKQGKFFDMYKVLYENQTDWSSQSDPLPTFTGYAKQLGLDVTKFQSDYASGEINDIINADYQEAVGLGATSTPTFVLNGKRIETNPDSAEAFEKLIADAVAAAKKQ